MGEEELKLALETLRGELKRLDTVMKMSVAEQRRINAEMGESMKRQGREIEESQERLDRMQIRMATYTGGLMALWVVFQIMKNFLK